MMKWSASSPVGMKKDDCVCLLLCFSLFYQYRLVFNYELCEQKGEGIQGTIEKIQFFRRGIVSNDCCTPIIQGKDQKTNCFQIKNQGKGIVVNPGKTEGQFRNG